MEKYKILCELIRKEQLGEEITEEEKNTAVSIFLNGKNECFYERRYDETSENAYQIFFKVYEIYDGAFEDEQSFRYC